MHWGVPVQHHGQWTSTGRGRKNKNKNKKTAFRHGPAPQQQPTKSAANTTGAHPRRKRQQQRSQQERRCKQHRLREAAPAGASSSRGKQHCGDTLPSDHAALTSLPRCPSAVPPAPVPRRSERGQAMPRDCASADRRACDQLWPTSRRSRGACSGLRPGLRRHAPSCHGQRSAPPGKPFSSKPSSGGKNGWRCGWSGRRCGWSVFNRGHRTYRGHGPRCSCWAPLPALVTWLQRRGAAG